MTATGSIVGVAVASGLYALVSLACMLALLNRTGYRADELSTAECSDAAEWGAESAGAEHPAGAAAQPDDRGTLKPAG
ncbi:major facilitator transporter [Burkholderia cepacia GG4]|uniref:Major facilitator transporter n=1 Tax=Burkholderia cepacia GG4 TaxID=1009846 RepID=A0A9W3K2U7_BURCE|nr:major facilitator transporter [Burkholderia cepacia GG4]